MNRNLALPEAGSPAADTGDSAARPQAIWRWLPSLPLLVALAALLRATAQPLLVLNDPDTYLHIAAGRWIIQHRALPLADPFSHTMGGAAWVPHEWLAELILAAAYTLGGWNAVVVATALCFAVAIAILSRSLLRHLEPLPALVVVIAVIGQLLPHLLARPHILVLPIVVLWCARLFDARDAATTPPLWQLPLMTLWANLHGSFMFGLALAAFLAFEAIIRADNTRLRRQELRGWAVFLFLAVLASLLTPNGVAGFLQPFRLLAMPTLQSSFGEWASPSIAQVPAVELWVLGTIGLALLAGIRLPVTRLILLLGLFHMAFQHVRHVDLLGFVAPLAVAQPFGTGLRASTPVGSRLSKWLEMLATPAGPRKVAVAMVLAAMIIWPTAVHPVARADEPVTPATALAAAERLGLSGPVLNEEGFGGYLAFRGIPTFIDGRIEMHGDAFLATYLKAERGDEGVLTQLLDQYRIEWTLFSPAAGAVTIMDRLPEWRRIYADEFAIIHARAGDPPRLDSHHPPL